MSKSVFITGATRGIGRELVVQLRASGYAVFGTGRDRALLESLKSETGCLGETADLTDPGQAVEIYQKARAALGQVDVLVNNAGLNHVKELSRTRVTATRTPTICSGT